MAADTGPVGDIDPKAKIFISYSRKDMAFADRLEAALKARGFEPLIDRSDIFAFEDWWARIRELIGKADTVVFVLSPDAVTSDVAVQEVDYAASLNKRLAPIVYRPVDDSAVPQALRRLNFIFFDDPDRFDASADHLAAALRTDIGWIRRHTDFGEQARRWAAAGRPGPRGLLLRSPLLEEAERWIASRPPDAPAPSPDTVEFIALSRRAAIGRRRRAQIFAVVLAVIVAAAATAWWHEQQLNENLFWFFNVRGQPLTADRDHALQPKDVFRDCSGCPEMVVIPAGTFTMGGDDPGTVVVLGNTPRHSVTITEPLAVSRYALTFEEWDACADHGDCDRHIDDNRWGRRRRPAINVSWEDAQRYIAWLSRMTGKPYRLLTEAEWEYAARGGTTTEFYWGDAGEHEGHANCDDCGSSWDDKQTAPVGSFAPNPFGLYDMAGNVYQWVQDCEAEDYVAAPEDGSAIDERDCDVRIMRGGAWDKSIFLLGPDIRASGNKGARSTDVGFRIARALGASPAGIAEAPRNAAPAPAPPAAANEPPANPSEASSAPPQLAWPVHGSLIAQKAGNKGNGIDIAAPEGTPIAAAADGVVALTGDLKDYGNFIMLRHGGGYLTAYAHARELLVKKGVRVHQGQIIARVGRTGSVTSPQLHFELRKGGTPIDPIPLLPKQQ
jgi:formylglycine-generating enzyme required for sulfatase activity